MSTAPTCGGRLGPAAELGGCDCPAAAATSGAGGGGVSGRDPWARGSRGGRASSPFRRLPATEPGESLVPHRPAPALGPRGWSLPPWTWDARLPDAEERRPSKPPASRPAASLSPRAAPASDRPTRSPKFGLGAPRFPPPPIQIPSPLSGGPPPPGCSREPLHALTSPNVTDGTPRPSPAPNFHAEEKSGLVSPAV